jgi:primosomal protein N' (replication factor Y)
MLPAGLAQQADILYSLTGRPPEGEVTDTQARLLSLLKKRGPLRGAQINTALPHTNWRLSARILAKRGLLTAQSFLPPPLVQPKLVRTVQLACPPEAALAALPELGRPGTKSHARRQAILNFLLREPGPVEVTWVYAESGGKLADLQFLADRGLVVLGESEIWRDPMAQMDFQPNQPPPLTHGQQAVWTEIKKHIQEAAAGRPVRPVLLHGITGSGKTEIYLHAVAEIIRQGKQAIVLVPEIALTPQTLRRFAGRFPGQVGLLHSGLSPGERYDTWRRARAGELAVMVGPRSALFTPFPNPGLIVVDECHDESYYQSESVPNYHAVEAAAGYAHQVGAVCLMGSATPDITSTYRCQQGQWRYLSLPQRILAHREVINAQVDHISARGGQLGEIATRFRPLEAQADTTDLPPVQRVDMRLELQAGNRSIFSRELQSALGQVLALGQQAILFLNRRGTATYVFCRDCGYTLKCPRCDLPLTYHDPKTELICHQCSYKRKMPVKCPECGSRRIRQYGTGTERVEAEVQALFPQARTLRWDYETTRKKMAHEIILSHFIAHRADVLVGTQMLAKGLDLPMVTLVGVVLADVGLNLPDYRAAERTFQVLTQVAGRAGRSPLGGRVILQTFQPEHYAIQAAAGHDYKSFFRQELEYRRRLGYPPFARLVRLEYRHADPEQAERSAREMAAQIRAWLVAGDRRETQMIGPVPCFFARLGGLYRWQIVLRGPDPASLLRDRPLGDWRVEPNPTNLL